MFEKEVVRKRSCKKYMIRFIFGIVEIRGGLINIGI